MEKVCIIKKKICETDAVCKNDDLILCLVKEL